MTTINSSFANHNNEKVSKYWDAFNKGARNGDIPICFITLRNSGDICDKLKIIRQKLYLKDETERFDALKKNILCLFREEINFIFNNRKIIIEDSSLSSFAIYELFSWMELCNSEIYIILKETIQIQLNLFSKKKDIGELEIKDWIICLIANVLYNFYIQL